MGFECDRTYFYGSCAAFGMFCVSASFGWIQQNYPRILHGDLGYPVTQSNFFLIDISFVLGSTVSAIPTSFLLNIFGPNDLLIYAFIIGLIGWILVLGGTHYLYLVFGLMLLGVFGGTYIVTVPLYLFDISRAKNSGRVAMLNYIGYTLGLTYAFVFGDMFEWIYSDLLICCVPTVVLFILIFPLPESPRFAIQNGHFRRGHLSLQLLRGRNEDLETELTFLKRMTQIKLKLHKKFVAIFSGKSKVTIRFLVLIMVHTVQHINERSLFLYFGAYTMVDAEPTLSPRISLILLSICLWILTPIPITCVDRIGRRMIVIISCTIMVICHGSIAFFTLETIDPLFREWFYLSVLFLSGFGYSIGLGPVPMVLVYDLIDWHLRPLTIALLTVFQNLFDLLISSLFFIFEIQARIYVAAFGLTTVNSIFLVVIVMYVKETKPEIIQI